MGRKSEWLYSVYRTSDDRLMALDVTAAQAAEIMNISEHSFYNIWIVNGGMNSRWTITRQSRKEVEMESYE